MRLLAGAGALGALAALALAGGCGDRELDAPEAIEELNDAGAGLMLGEALPDVEEGTEVTTLSFEGVSAPAAGAEGSAGAIVVLEGTEEAQTEFTRCENAVSFVCYRIANTVLRFSDISPRRQQRLAVALQAVRSDG